MTRQRLRLWGWISLAALLCFAFLRLCVRIVPGDGVAPGSAGSRHSVASGVLLIPVAGVAPDALVDTFTQARANGERPHDAIDIMAPRGRRVIAATDGLVEKLFWSVAGGRTLYQRSADNRRVYYYAHLDSYASSIRAGMRLRRGQSIGTVGSTGNASDDAPHLHFAVHDVGPRDKWYEGRAINPYPLLVNPR